MSISMLKEKREKGEGRMGICQLKEYYFSEMLGNLI